MSERGRRNLAGAFCLAVGAAIGWLGLHLPSAGLIALGLALVLGGLRDWRWWPAWLLVGAALPWLWVAWRNRSGPGWRTSTADGISGGAEIVNPTTFVIVAVALLAPALALLLIGRLVSARVER